MSGPGIEPSGRSRGLIPESVEERRQRLHAHEHTEREAGPAHQTPAMSGHARVNTLGPEMTITIYKQGGFSQDRARDSNPTAKTEKKERKQARGRGRREEAGPGGDGDEEHEGAGALEANLHHCLLPEHLQPTRQPPTASRQHCASHATHGAPELIASGPRTASGSEGERDLGELRVGEGEGPETEVGGGVGDAPEHVLDGVDHLRTRPPHAPSAPTPRAAHTRTSHTCAVGSCRQVAGGGCALTWCTISSPKSNSCARAASPRQHRVLHNATREQVRAQRLRLLCEHAHRTTDREHVMEDAVPRHGHGGPRRSGSTPRYVSAAPAYLPPAYSRDKTDSGGTQAARQTKTHRLTRRERAGSEGSSQQRCRRRRPWWASLPLHRAHSMSACKTPTTAQPRSRSLQTPTLYAEPCPGRLSSTYPRSLLTPQHSHVHQQSLT